MVWQEMLWFHTVLCLVSTFLLLTLTLLKIRAAALSSPIYTGFHMNAMLKLLYSVSIFEKMFHFDDLL